MDLETLRRAYAALAADVSDATGAAPTTPERVAVLRELQAALVRRLDALDTRTHALDTSTPKTIDAFHTLTLDVVYTRELLDAVTRDLERCLRQEPT